MSTPKVYLAKSNRSNPDLVTRVRQTLSSYNIEIVEYTGGQYSHKPLKECEFLVVVPDLTNFLFDEFSIDIGKGLFEQIENFNNIKNIIIISEDNLDVREIDCVDILDEDDYITYATLVLRNDKVTSFEKVCKNVFGERNSVISSEFGYKYLLSKRK